MTVARHPTLESQPPADPGALEAWELDFIEKLAQADAARLYAVFRTHDHPGKAQAA